VRPFLPGGRALPAPRPHCPKSADGGGYKQRKPPPSSTNALRAATTTTALLDQTTTAALPPDRDHLTHGTCRGAINWTLIGPRQP
jgi:hypothetical protein